MSRKNLLDNELTKMVGLKIRSLRQGERWTLEQMSAMLNTSNPALSKIENGITDMSISRLQQIADLFGIAPSLLLGQILEDEHRQLQAELQEKIAEIHRKDQQIIALQNKVINLLSRTDVNKQRLPECS